MAAPDGTQCERRNATRAAATADALKGSKTARTRAQCSCVHACECRVDTSAHSSSAGPDALPARAGQGAGGVLDAARQPRRCEPRASAWQQAAEAAALGPRAMC